VVPLFPPSGLLSQLPRLSISQVCVSPLHILRSLQGRGSFLDLGRLLLGAFFHADDIHLYYNMSSLLWKGRMLEPLVGRRHFAIMLVLFSILCNMLYVLGSYLLANCVDYPGPFHSCAVGFSAVLFALKVILTRYSTSPYMTVMGSFTVPTKYVYWVELFLIQVLVPGASFFGHLCGVVIGILYVKGYLNPLFKALEALLDIFQHQPLSNTESHWETEDSSRRRDTERRSGYIRNGVYYPSPSSRTYGY
jgi:rhomboid domain-containing protein 1